MSVKPKAAVIVFPGSNGDRDLGESFERAGFAVQYVDSRDALPSVQAVGLPGGFSYGDYWRAGMLACQATAVQALPEFCAQGGLAIGICNGFQILIEGGLLPGGLNFNNPPGFRHRWIEVEVTTTDSPWLQGLEAGQRLRMPMAHGEGNYFHPGGAAEIRRALTYPSNPNGSLADTAGILDPTGHIIGVMPHPERASDPVLGSSDGLGLFQSAHRWLAQA